MQFESNQTVGQTTKRVSFDFFDKLNYSARVQLRQIFRYLGAIEIIAQKETWDFPNHVSNETISEIIHNTCFVCGGLMKDSEAFDNTYVSHNDFGNDVGQRGTTMSKSGQAQLIKVRKCMECGHSHT